MSTVKLGASSMETGRGFPLSTGWIHHSLDGLLINEEEPGEAEMLLRQAAKGIEKALNPH